MGKRARRRTRDARNDATPSAQHMARVNVDDEVWRALRIEAVRTGRSVAGYLGALVTAEVERVRRREDAQG
jgi:plasmid stability protein